MKKSEMLIDVDDMIGGMQFMIGEAGINAKRLAIPREPESRDYKQVKEAHRWVSVLYKTVFNDLMVVRRLRTEKIWEYYKAIDETELREVKMMQDEFLKLKKYINSVKRPVFFKKKGQVKKKGKDNGKN